MKKCSKCKEEKELVEFYNHKNSKSGLTSQCRVCMSETRNKRKLIQRDYMRNLRENSNEEVKATRRKSWHKEPKRKILQSAKARAKRRDIEFTITIDDINIPELCPILGVPFKQGAKNDYETTYSIDRIDNTKEYTKENIQIITKKANSMKNSGSPEELLKLADWIYKTFL